MQMRSVIRRVLLTAVCAAAVACILMPERMPGVAALSASAAVVLREALRRAAGRPALQALTCCVVLTCAFMAVATCTVDQQPTWPCSCSCNLIACLPAAVAGECCPGWLQRLARFLGCQRVSCC